MHAAAEGLRAGAFAETLAAGAGSVEAQLFVRHTVMASVTGLVVALVTVALLPGWLGASLAVGSGLVFCGRMLHLCPSRWLINLCVFGLTAGLVELIADAWLVRATGTLVYPLGGPFLLDSPAYMPVAWFGMLSAGMALSMSLRRHLSLSSTSVIVALALGLYIPLYEGIAAVAGWWHYRSCPMVLGVVPVYVVLGEILLGLPLVACAERLKRSGPGLAIVLGSALGLWILASYHVAFTLVTRLDAP